MRTCGNIDSQKECIPVEKFSRCVCKAGYVFINGACVAEAQCGKSYKTKYEYEFLLKLKQRTVSDWKF